MSRVAVVTGGASGMGLSICQRLVERGHQVAVLDVNAEGAQQAADKLRKDGQVMAWAVDVSDRPAVDEALAQVRQALGPVEIMMTCAGIARWEPFGEISAGSWERVLAVNLTGTFHCVQAALPDMVAARWGRVVTFASSGFQMGVPLCAHYLASKGAVIGMTRGVAREYAPLGITANTIVPHIIDTPMMREGRDAFAKIAGSRAAGEVDVTEGIPVGRIGTGEDIAAACLFLCSDEAGYFTGQLMGVNGGALS
jgi:2-hydroxycyclohexanecarboxyl-CoA dehydrogenase